MRMENRKTVLVGTGMVGMSYAYALLNQNVCDELVLIDLNKNKAEGEAMDLNHGLAFSAANMKIYAGDYEDCRDAGIVVIAAGAKQKPDETRLSLLKRNALVFRSIVQPIVKSGFAGIFLIATNPVDIMTRIAEDLSGFPSSRVIGSGTALDTARLRYVLGEYFDVDPRNVHAYVIGEHGDSEFVPWSQAMIATKSVRDICVMRKEKFDVRDLDGIEREVARAAYQIIEAKGATYYGIGMALVRITKAIFGDERSVLTISAKLGGEYGVSGVYAGVPVFVGKNGADRVLTLNLTAEELKKFENSCRVLETSYDEIEISSL